MTARGREKPASLVCRYGPKIDAGDTLGHDNGGVSVPTYSSLFRFRRAAPRPIRHVRQCRALSPRPNSLNWLTTLTLPDQSLLLSNLANYTISVPESQAKILATIAAAPFLLYNGGGNKEARLYQVYFNTGTWQRYHELTIRHPARRNFMSMHVMSYLTFSGGRARRPRFRGLVRLAGVTDARFRPTQFPPLTTDQ